MLNRFLLTCAFTAFVSVPASASLMATATYTDMQVSPGVFQYDLTLKNTGTTTIGTFWFSWLPGAGLMLATPTGILSPLGWSSIATNAGTAIQWTSLSGLLAPGSSIGGFKFDSTETPAQFAAPFPGPGLGTGLPDTTSFVYIAAPLADPGQQIVATAASGNNVPEPATLGTMLFGIGWLAARRRVKR